MTHDPLCSHHLRAFHACPGDDTCARCDCALIARARADVSEAC